MKFWVWSEELAWEMVGWDLRGRLDLLPESEDDGQDIEPENFCNARTRGVICLRKQDDEAVAFLVLVSTKKVKYHSPEEGHVDQRVLGRKDGKRTQVGNHERWTRRRQSNGSKRSRKDMTTVFSEAGLLIKERKASWHKKNARRARKERVI